MTDPIAELESARLANGQALDGMMAARDQIMNLNPARMTTAEVSKTFGVVVQCFDQLAAALFITDGGLESSIAYLRKFREGLN